jgi:hypothetical protein
LSCCCERLSHVDPDYYLIGDCLPDISERPVFCRCGIR